MPVENLVTLFSPELIRHVASFMHPNYVATAFKLSCKDVAQAVREQFTTIQLRGEPRALQSFRFGSIIIALAEQPWPGAAFVAHWGRPEPWRPLNRRERHRLLCLAASSHHEPSLDAALAHCGTVIQADALASAIAAGDLAACRRLHESEGYDMEPELAAAAAGVAGSLPVLQQYYERWGSRLLWTAGQRRQLLMAAAASPTPDWAAKCEWLWAQWGGAAAGLGAGLGHVEGIDERVSNIMRRPDFPQRLQLLASYRLRDMIDRYAPEAAGTIGSTAARGHVFPAPRDLAAVLAVSCRNVRSRNEDLARTNMLRSLRYLLLEEPGAVQQGGADKDWSSLFQNAARSGADLPLLQHLHEQPLSCSAFRQVLRGGNWAAADWLVRYGLVATSRQELVESLVFEDARSGTAVIAELQWAVGMGGGQGQQEQVQWTPGLHAALRELLASSCGDLYDLSVKITALQLL
eukprot:XP_001699502.1 predicted protein [Chlamydomonas reinhardtii]